MVLEHLDLQENQAQYAILTGNPKRVETLAESFHDPKFVTDRRGLTTFHAKLAPDSDREVFIISSGMGSPSIAIVAEELLVAGVHTMIRVGTCGPIQNHIGVGDIVASTGVVRDEGTTHRYVRSDYPAVPHHDMLFALNDVRGRFDWPLHIGITHAKDTFYTQKPDFNLDKDAIRKHWKGLRDANVLVTEMEASVLYVLGSIRRARALALLVTSSMDRKNEQTAQGLKAAAELARQVMLTVPDYDAGPDAPAPRRVDQSILDDLRSGLLD